MRRISGAYSVGGGFVNLFAEGVLYTLGYGTEYHGKGSCSGSLSVGSKSGFNGCIFTQENYDRLKEDAPWTGIFEIDDDGYWRECF